MDFDTTPLEGKKIGCKRGILRRAGVLKALNIFQRQAEER